MRPTSLPLAILLALSASTAFAGQAGDDMPPLARDAEDHSLDEGDGALLRLQVLLDRARFSPGEIDAMAGSKGPRPARLP